MSRFASLLLAAGKGMRLRPLTKTIPKPALPLLDIPLGAFGLADLHQVGGPLFVNLSSGHAAVQEALSSFSQEADFVYELPEPFGSAGTLHSLKERLNGPVVTRNADSFTEASVIEAIGAHLDSGAMATITTMEVDDHADLISNGERAVSFIDRRLGSSAGEIWLGIAVLEPEALGLIGPERPRDMATALLAPLIERGEVAVCRHDGYFIDVGTIPRYLDATIALLDGSAHSPIEPPGTIVEVDGGRAYVGPGAQVDERSLRAGTALLAGAIVPKDAVVERAIVWPGEQVPSGTHVIDGVWALGALQR